jgi:hypothetical protein
LRSACPAVDTEEIGTRSRTVSGVLVMRTSFSASGGDR